MLSRALTFLFIPDDLKDRSQFVLLWAASIFSVSAQIFKPLSPSLTLSRVISQSAKSSVNVTRGGVIPEMAMLGSD